MNKKRQRLGAHSGLIIQYCIFMLYFLELTQLLMEETNKYYQQYFETLDEGWSPLPDMSIQETSFFLAMLMQMRHDQKETLKSYWNTTK
jgi:hypothetical protein